MKLLRILASYDASFCIKLKNLGLARITKEFLSTKRDINVRNIFGIPLNSINNFFLQINLLKLQIESCRFLRLYFNLIPDESLFGELICPVRYLLEWHYQFLNYDQENHFIIRQHAASLIYLLSVGNMVIVFPQFSEIFKMCLCKWFTMASRSGTNEVSYFQLNLASGLIQNFCSFLRNSCYQPSWMWPVSLWHLLRNISSISLMVFSSNFYKVQSTKKCQIYGKKFLIRKFR